MPAFYSALSENPSSFTPIAVDFSLIAGSNQVAAERKTDVRMRRIEFLRKMVVAGAVLFAAAACSLKDNDNAFVTCMDLVAEEEGPYPYPAGEALSPANQSDITGGQTGSALTLKISVVNTNTGCSPVAGVSVHIWHCNKDGYYSGYANQNGANGIKDFTGQKWLRGYQITDKGGNVTFKTIYPGWETGRSTHIHVEVFIDGTLKGTSQFAFPEKANDLVNASSQYSSRGANPTKNNTDPVFGDNNASNLNAETVLLDGAVDTGFTATYMIGLRL